MPKPAKGRDAIYRGKDLTKAVRGFVTPDGRRKFEKVRTQVSKAAGVKTAKDGDVIEALVNGLEKALVDIRARR